MTGRTEFNGYVVLVWGLPATVVIAGIVTVFIAFSAADPLVSDDYYRDGLAINQLKDAEQRATLLQLRADIEVSAGSAQLVLKGNLPFPETLELAFEHPTHIQHDQHWQLRHDQAGVYPIAAAQLTQELQQGRWYISLAPHDGVWRLRTTGNLADNTALLSSP